jgi:hypothetical protein
LLLVGQMRCNFALANFDAAKKNAVDILPIEDISKDYLIEANFFLFLEKRKQTSLPCLALASAGRKIESYYSPSF